MKTHIPAIASCLALLWTMALQAETLPTPSASRYLIHQNGTVTDTHTRLMWKRCTEGNYGNECRQGDPIEYTWHEAMAKFKQGVSFAGYSDWRLPSHPELRTLIYCSNRVTSSVAAEHSCSGAYRETAPAYQSPTIDLQAFPNTATRWFWSSSFLEVYGYEAPGFVDFRRGTISYHDSIEIPGHADVVGQVRLVRVRQYAISGG